MNPRAPGHPRALPPLFSRTRSRLAGPRRARPFPAVIGFFEGPGRCHHEDEEFSLFPRLQGEEDANALVAALDAEHRTLEAIYLSVRTVAQHLAAGTGQPEPQAVADLAVQVAAMAAGYRAHLAREEADLFPLAKRLLDEPQIRAVAIEMRLRRGGSA